ncbi:MAG TPA: polyprenyl synthetase family protein [Parachlamydiaceae bacterium]|nr:polyprenyl synthetase family protein [Parachlamydiaceae bacterium]
MPANHSDTSSPSLKDAFKSYQELIQSKIKEKVAALPTTGILNEACEYALLNGGKRFRPTLVYMVAEALGQGRDVSNAAMAVEFFHTASLVADDLPCMDDDEERRSKPTVHKVYGEAIALLVSYALIAEGYGAIAHGLPQKTQASGESSGSGFKIIAMALENATFNTGLSGATGGQFLDIFPPDLSEATLREIIHKKTTSLFEIAFVFGWLFGGGDSKDLALVKSCASHFGLAFQVADDLGDVEQDLKNGRKVNMAGVFGVERAEKILEEELFGYRATLKSLKIDSPALLGLATSLEGGFRTISG